MKMALKITASIEWTLTCGLILLSFQPAYAEKPRRGTITTPPVAADDSEVGGGADDDQHAPQMAAVTQQAVANEKAIVTLPQGSPEREQRERDRQQFVGQSDALVAKCPSCPATLTNGALMSSKMGEYLKSPEFTSKALGLADRAVDAAEHATKDPKKTDKLVNALNTRGYLLEKAGEYERAHADAEYALKIRPGDRTALAMLHATNGRARAQASGAGAPSPGAGGNAAASASRPNPGASSSPAGGPGVSMTSAAALEAQKHIALGWSRLKLDSAEALKSFDAAVAADPKNAAVRVQRSKARLAAGDAPGALGDAEDALALEPRLGEAYAARADAKRALGRAEAELLADYEAAAKFDGRFTDAYKAFAARGAGSASAGVLAGKSAADMTGRSAPDGYWALLTHPPKKWGLFALICVFVAAVGGVLAPLMLKKRPSVNGATPTPTPRP